MNILFYANLESRSKKISARCVNTMFTCLLGPLKKSPHHDAVPLKSKVPVKIH